MNKEILTPHYLVEAFDSQGEETEDLQFTNKAMAIKRAKQVFNTGEWHGVQVRWINDNKMIYETIFIRHN